MRALNLDQLRTFSDVIELGSFSAAAERLNLSQPAVSLQIRELERRLGVRLIERVGRRATATAAGDALLAHARRIDSAVIAATGEMQQYARGVFGYVRLGTGATACIHLLPPLLRDLRQRFPSLEIAVTTGDTAEIVRAVDDNMIDIGLVTLPARGRSLSVTPLLADPFVAISAHDAERLPDILSPADAAALPMIAYGPGGNTRRVIDAWFRTADVPLRPIMELGSIEAIKEMVGAGLGCAIVPAMAIAGKPGPSPYLVRSLTPALNRSLGIVMRRDKHLHQGLREALRALEALRSGD